MVKHIFLICPVRGVTDEQQQAIKAYVAQLEAIGQSVYWPHRDTDQADAVGLAICQTNRAALLAAEAVHVWWSGTSQGSVFDLGMAFAAYKPVVLANPQDIQWTPEKSFANMLLALNEEELAYGDVPNAV